MDEYVWVAEDGEYSSMFVAGVFKDAETYKIRYPNLTWTLHEEDPENIYWSGTELVELSDRYGRLITRYIYSLTKTLLQ